MKIYTHTYMTTPTYNERMFLITMFLFLMSFLTSDVPDLARLGDVPDLTMFLRR